MKNHIIFFDKKSILGHEIEYNNIKSFLRSNKDNQVVDWECYGNDLKGDLNQPRIGEIHTYIIPYDVLVSKDFVMSEFITNSVRAGKAHIIYFNDRSQLEKPKIPALGIPTDRGTFILESMLEYISNPSSIGPLSLLERGTELLHVKEIPNPSGLLDYFSAIFFGLKKISPELAQHRNRIKSLFSYFSDEVNKQELFKKKNFSLKVGFSSNLLVLGLRWRTTSVNPLVFMENCPEWSILSHQVSACWFNFFREKKEVEMLCLCSLAFDYVKSLPNIANAKPLGGYVIEMEGKKSEVISLKKDEQVTVFDILTIPKKSFKKDTIEFVQTNKMTANKVNNIWIAKSSIMGHGFNIRELVSQMDVKSEAVVNKWVVEKGNWITEALKKDDQKINSFVVPHNWLIFLPEELPKDFLDKVNSGKIRILYFDKKGNYPISRIPTFQIPSDKGSLLMDSLITMSAQSHYSGIQALFPPKTPILKKETPFLRGFSGRGFDILYNQIKEFGDEKITEFGLKINFASKNILRLIFEKNKGKNEEKLILKMGCSNNLFAFSVNFPSDTNPMDWIYSDKNWKLIYSGTSSSWFNYFPSQNRVEVTYILSFSIDYEKTFSEIKHAFPLGVEIISDVRLTGEDSQESSKMTDDVELSQVVEKSSNEEVKSNKKDKGYTFESDGTKIEKEAYSFEVAKDNQKKLLTNVEHNPHILCLSLYLYHKLVGQLVFDELMNQKNEKKLRLYWKLPELKEKYNVQSWKEVYLKLHRYHKEKEDFYLNKVKGEFDMVSLICDRLGNSISHFYKRGAFYGQEPNELFNFTNHAPDLFSFSTRIGFRECIKYFIEWNLISDKFVSRSLDASIRRNKFDVVKVVIESIDYVDWLESRELIFWVIEMNFVEIMETLIEKGINIHRSRVERESPLCYATMKKRFEITKMLVENGADLNKAKGLPLMYAVENKDLQMIAYFLETKTMKLELINEALSKAEGKSDNLQVASLLISEVTERELIESQSI